MELNKIYCGKSLEVMKGWSDNSVDLIVTDPPYGYKFMGKDWDKVVIGVDTWRECLRVLKPGAFAFIMSAPRQDVLSHMIVNLDKAGFNTGFTSIYWAYGQGFPKAQNTVKILTKQFNYGNMLVYGKGEKIPQLSLQEVWKTIIHQTRAQGESDDRAHLPEMLAYLEQEKQYEIHAHSRSEIQSLPISERQKQSFLEGWNNLQKTQRELWTCEICKMPTGIYIDGTKRWLCYVSQIDNGAIAWESIDENGVRSSYQSRPTRQFNQKFKIVCEQCRTQTIREKSGSYAGFQPKPAVEVILVCMKPLSEKTFVDQAMKNGKGVTWLDDGRIPYKSEPKNLTRNNKEPQTIYGGGKGIPPIKVNINTQGRFPANLLVSDDVLNNGIDFNKGGSISDAGPRENKVYGTDKNPRGDWEAYGDSGSFSRYFNLDKWVQKTFPFLIVPKAAKSEKNEGCEELEAKRFKGNKNRAHGTGEDYLSGGKWRKSPMVKNNHPTVKPIKLKSYLITLGSRPNDVVLDPFIGSGTTAIACKLLSRNVLGIDQEKEYCEIAQKRTDAKLVQLEMFLT